jgi:hypothetical protein
MNASKNEANSSSTVAAVQKLINTRRCQFAGDVDTDQIRRLPASAAADVAGQMQLPDLSVKSVALQSKA